MLQQWTHEPDELFWIDKDSKLECYIVRHPEIGHLCGYVKLPKGHRYAKKGVSYHDIPSKVHGCITFLENCEMAGQKETAHWIGFDCGHSSDYTPNCDLRIDHPDNYKPFGYVIKEVMLLAAEIWAASI